MTAAPTYVRVLLPLRLGWIPTYSSATPLEPGRRVCVELGSRRYDGVVWCSLAQPDLPPERIQPVLEVQEDLPRVTPEELRFWQFLSDYYLCTLGEVYKAAYPLLKVRSEHTAADMLARLRERLARREQDLAQKRHGERVKERLRAGCEELRRQIRALEQREAAPQTQRELPGRPLAVTGGGRLAIYRERLRAVLDAGHQVLVLNPETAFCDRMEEDLRDEFGDRL
ncbi:MAG: hypothetical protein IJV37_07750, partial [Bacteroidales bacterium]|nr:hypothetical protein [Bacteroidales bacterium]